LEYGLFFQLPRSAEQDTTTRYQETLDQIVLGDELGFDTAWLAEMHFVPEYSMLPSPMIVGATAAALTERIRIGIGVALLPLHEPIRAAEDAATLDVLSGGRLDFGIGRGAIAAHFDGFGVPMRERSGRFNEVIDIIRKSWADQPMSYDGEFFQYQDVNVEPKPIQKPGPPLRLAANSEEQITRAGQEGWKVMFSPITGTLPDLKARSALYQNLRTERDGSPPPPEDIGWLAAVHVAEDGDQAREEAHEALTTYLQVVAKTSTEGYLKHGGDPDDLPSLVRRFRDSTYEEILRDMAIVGSPAECREKLAAVTEEFGAGHILTWFNAGGLIPHDKVQRSMKLWMEEVVG
jgi:alkanesulfonate monooxygenase SsuD/methylene tetrahydromethanopterin reductase-like flavin-dependent oxidoreductase (luciferase family)